MKLMKSFLRWALVGAFWIVVWWAIAFFVGLPKLLPGPKETALAFARLCGTDTFWRSVGMTLLRVALGYGFAVMAGVLLAAGCHWIRGVETLLAPQGSQRGEYEGKTAASRAEEPFRRTRRSRLL